MNKESYSLGGEQSGHIILGEYSNTGDGVLVALKILEILKKFNQKSTKLFDNYVPYFQEMLNLPITKVLSAKKRKSILSLSQKNKPHLRNLIRESGTEPLIRILVEGKNKNEVKNEIKMLKNKIEDLMDVK